MMRGSVVLRLALALLPALVAALVAGCGDPVLWARYRAEREFWRARRLAERAGARPGEAAGADYRRAVEAFRAIPARFPAAVWAGARRGSMAREVGAVSGRAAIACARLEELRGQADLALAGYAGATRDYASIPVVALEAAAARADLLSRLERGAEALDAWIGVARDYPLVDPEGTKALQPALDAPLRAAAMLDRAGRGAERDSLLEAAEVRLLESLTSAPGGAAAPALCLALAALRQQRGDLDGALEALRRTLREPADRANAPLRVLALARASLEGGRPDSARAYAEWAERGFDGRVRAQGMLYTARAWEAGGPPDSALAAYARLLEAYPKAQDSSAEARFRRGDIFERRGSWEPARSEYRALAAAQPTHPLSFEAVLRVVQHHARLGEDDLARMEARRALATMDYLIATQRDETVEQWARRTRAELMIATGDAEAACGALADLWRRYPGTPLGTDAGLKAAGLAELALGDRTLALELYREVAAGARDPDARRRARAAAERLQRGRG